MMNDKLNTNITDALATTSTAQISQALETLKADGNVSYLPHIFNALQTNIGNEIISKKIISFLADVKDKKTIDVYIEAFADETYQSIQKELLSVCWQNGLDFSPYYSTFVDIIVNSSDYWTAFEAFTVLENLPEPLTEDQIRAAVEKIEEVKPLVSDDKYQLLNDLLTLFPR